MLKYVFNDTDTSTFNIQHLIFNILMFNSEKNRFVVICRLYRYE
jgi:hypothetical protein